MNRGCEETVTSTGNTLCVPAPTGNRTQGNQRSHCADPRDRKRSGQQDQPRHAQAGSWPRSPETGAKTRPAHPLREHRGRHPRVLHQQRANCRLPALIPESCGARTYVGGALRADGLRDRVPKDPNRAVIDLIDSSSARCNGRISAQSSTVITHPIVWNGWPS